MRPAPNEDTQCFFKRAPIVREREPGNRIEIAITATSSVDNIQAWLRAACAGYQFDIDGLLRKKGADKPWRSHLRASKTSGVCSRPAVMRCHYRASRARLPTIIEVSLADYLIRRLEETSGARFQRGTTRGYPDLEISRAPFGGYHAVDIKAARLNARLTRTNSRITLYTGNTYFRHPDNHYPGMFRPFGAYETHLAVLALFTFAEHIVARVTDLRLLVHESWRIASRQRSSKTRNYIGAVTSLPHLVQGQGEFISADEFYSYWRAYKFDTATPRHARKPKDPDGSRGQIQLLL